MKNENFVSPKPKELEFTRYWDLFIDSVVERDNFRPHHLEQLTILCSLYQELNKVQDEIKEQGYYFENEGRHGSQIKTHPLVVIRDKMLGEIRHYTKLLDLTINKDKSIKENDDKDDWE